jgi:O-antigen/teichoic acid export membrane protein
MKKDLLLYLGAELLIKGMPFILIPYLANSLGVIAFADLSLYRSYAAIILVFVGLNAGAAISRYRYFYGKRNIDNLVLSSFVLMCIIGAIFLTISCIINNVLMILASVSSILQGALSALLSKYQSDKNVLRYISIQLSNVFISTCLTLIGFYILEPSVFLRVLSILIAVLIVLLVGFFGIKNTLNKRLLVKNSKYIVFFTFPLLINNLSLVAKGNVDRLLINFSYDAHTLGVMSAGMQIGSIITVLHLVINRTVTPYVFEYFKTNGIEPAFFTKKLFLGLTILSLLPSVIALFIDEKQYLDLLGEDFAGVKYYIVSYLFVLSFQFYIIILSWEFIYKNKIKYITYATIFGTILHLIFIFIFVNFDSKFIPYASLFSTFSSVFLLFHYRTKLIKHYL